MTSKGNRFGGFTDIPLGNRKISKNNFCFSFDKQKLYYDTIYVEWKSDNGPKFERGFRLGFDYNHSKKSFCENNDFGIYENFYDYEAYRIYLE